MTTLRDDIIRMAREAGIGVTDESLIPVWHLGIDYLERFAALVAAAEREACAKTAEQELLNTNVLMSMPPKSSAAWNILNAIRARSNT